MHILTPQIRRADAVGAAEARVEPDAARRGVPRAAAGRVPALEAAAGQDREEAARQPGTKFNGIKATLGHFWGLINSIFGRILDNFYGQF